MTDRTPCRFPAEVCGRHLLDQDGRPFFWLADTAWELVHRLTREEIVEYAGVRKRQDFNAVQFTILAELDGLHAPNPQGHLPLLNDDPTDPNPAYFDDVDFALKVLNDRGLAAVLLPTWGDKFNLKWGVGPEVFTPDNAAVYGDFLGDRYKNAAVVWMLGGDRPCETDEHREIVRGMAEGLRYGGGGRHLLTYHPGGGTTSVEAFGGDPAWLDFHCVQSGHHARADPADVIARGRTQAAKPVLESEPAYEDHPRMSADWKVADGDWSADDVLSNLYRAVLAGSPGVTYGCHSVWQMHDTARGHAPVNRVRRPWREALTLPVAESVGEMRRAFEALEWWELEPVAPGVARLPDGREVRHDGGHFVPRLNAGIRSVHPA